MKSECLGLVKKLKLDWSAMIDCLVRVPLGHLVVEAPAAQWSLIVIVPGIEGARSLAFLHLLKKLHVFHVQALDTKLILLNPYLC